MRHSKKINHLGRKSEHREAMLSNMATSLILNKKVNTTVAKAKALRVFVEPIITKAKEDSTHSRRIVFSLLRNKQAVSELFREVAVKVGDRPGGYTRILKTGTRLGDSAEMCIIELVDFNENMLGNKEDAKSKTRRSRRGAKKKETGAVTATEKKSSQVTAATTQEEVVESVSVDDSNVEVESTSEVEVVEESVETTEEVSDVSEETPEEEDERKEE